MEEKLKCVQTDGPVLYPSRLGNGVTTSLKNTAEHRVWRSMRNRCRANVGYRKRGIKCCDRWNRFRNFWDDMCPRPQLMYFRFDLHRLDGDAGYEQGNCIWAERERHRQDAREKKHTEPTRPYLDQPECEACERMQRKRGTMTCRETRMLCCEYWRVCDKNPKREPW